MGRRPKRRDFRERHHQPRWSRQFRKKPHRAREPTDTGRDGPGESGGIFYDGPILVGKVPAAASAMVLAAAVAAPVRVPASTAVPASKTLAPPETAAARETFRCVPASEVTVEVVHAGEGVVGMPAAERVKTAGEGLAARTAQ